MHPTATAKTRSARSEYLGTSFAQLGLLRFNRNQARDKKRGNSKTKPSNPIKTIFQIQKNKNSFQIENSN